MSSNLASVIKRAIRCVVPIIASYGCDSTDLDFDHVELALRRRAIRTAPGLGYVFPARSGRYAFAGYPGFFVVNERAQCALPRLESGGGHGRFLFELVRNIDFREVHDDGLEPLRTGLHLEHRLIAVDEDDRRRLALLPFV